ncbi:sensor histidine kinase [Paenibacillus whitsoniae]|uniref:Sensor histidine kinase n=1 Tax=Paenibacillus whitsoniae TaxID=2496558 RepID=A0A3S0ADZ6_9BACL|nr:sensor histidine kinase [Paenibacillus whitsoniae]RTE10734.1 sensor histidine kinase [Paenibacillus whitsoniae]
MYAFLSRSPIRIKLLIYFVPILILSVVLTGLLSYLSAVKQLEKNAYYLLNDTVEQTGGFINDKFYTVFEQLVLIENNSAFRNIMENKGQAVDQRRYDDLIDLRRQFEEAYQNHFQIIDSIYVAFNNGRSFNLQKDFVPKHVGINLSDWMARYSNRDSQAGYYWLNRHVDEVFDTVETRNVVSLFKMIGSQESAVSGVALINMRESYIRNILLNVKVSPNGVLALISPDGVMYSKDLQSPYVISDKVMNEIRHSADAQGSLREVSQSDRPMMIRYTTLSLNHWKLAAIVPESDILSNASQIKTITLYIVVIILLVFGVVATLVASSLSNPIRFLSKQVKRVGKGDLNVSFRLNEQNEIGVLAQGLESLVESVRDLLDKVKDEQEQKRQIELLALQAQIQPHFLYNTLGSIKHLVDLGEKEKASTMVSALTQFFRIGISKGREVISVREEIEHVRNYLLIQHIRYSTDFEFEIDIEEGLLDLPIMKLTLQPIVENAIYHGAKNKHGRVLIRITGSRQGRLAVLEVFDDGAGMSKERLVQIQASIQSPTVEEVPVTFGLRNVHKRLVLQFGDGFGLRLESREGEYTMVSVSIPITMEEV